MEEQKALYLVTAVCIVHDVPYYGNEWYTHATDRNKAISNACYRARKRYGRSTVLRDIRVEMLKAAHSDESNTQDTTPVQLTLW